MQQRKRDGARPPASLCSPPPPEWLLFAWLVSAEWESEKNWKMCFASLKERRETHLRSSSALGLGKHERKENWMTDGEAENRALHSKWRWTLLFVKMSTSVQNPMCVSYSFSAMVWLSSVFNACSCVCSHLLRPYFPDRPCCWASVAVPPPPSSPYRTNVNSELFFWKKWEIARHCVDFKHHFVTRMRAGSSDV